MGNSLILVNQDIGYVLTGVLSGKSAVPIVLWVVGVILFIIALILVIHTYIEKDPA
jgi:hypothetical protein